MHLPNIVRSIGNTLLFIDPLGTAYTRGYVNKFKRNSELQPYSLTRAWCIWEIFHTVDSGSKLETLMSPRTMDQICYRVMEKYAMGSGTKTIARRQYVSQAKCRKPKDLKMIQDAITFLGKEKIEEIIEKAIEATEEDIMVKLTEHRNYEFERSGFC